MEEMIFKREMLSVHIEKLDQMSKEVKKIVTENLWYGDYDNDFKFPVASSVFSFDLGNRKTSVYPG